MTTNKTPLLTSDVEQWINNRSEEGQNNLDNKLAQAESGIDLSIIIPAFNEQWRIPTTLIDIIDFFDSLQKTYEVVVVDDGSKDQTISVVQKFQKIRPQVKLVALAQNQGKGAAVRTGVMAAKGARILFADADGSTPIREIDRLHAAISAGADVAIGSRAAASKETTVVTSWYRKYPGRLFNFCVNTFILPGIADTQCGFKMFTARAAKFIFTHQKSNGFSFDVEILFLAQRAGLKISEVPINWVNVPGSKVNMLVDAMKMLRDIFIFRLRHRNISSKDYN